MKTTNTPQAQSEQNQTIDHTIKFHCAEDGVIDDCPGHTVFSNLFMFGAFALTKKYKYSNEAGWCEYQTDVEGLKTLESKIGESIALISDSVTMLGLMLVYVDKDEFGDNGLHDYAWLVAGLGELIRQLSHERAEISHSLQVLSKKSSGVTK